ncbi:hypothetical protein C789_3941 [Microcystis aeruginosa FACHB-905 = DIANCHI905]|uniref:Uncharacterized protein n=1 Tax=Microcystis aeruginosa PCC 7806SL TaxID=1903187 RepID=A0AB33BPB5_MICA7|nr:hypothetical protein BH695_2951 [Microcystis aeruginosa PCC 7806SL]ELS46284.1 hypothetical protein C789_3941 [Microcystis aeruginosa FACHB-905 = DIANCHI905]
MGLIPNQLLIIRLTPDRALKTCTPLPTYLYLSVISLENVIKQDVV